MQLTLFNGSPRGAKSNTSLLLEPFTDGFIQHSGQSVDLFYLIQRKQLQKHVERFRDSDAVIIAFPLYTDAMPGIVKEFIEALQPLCGNPDNPLLGFIVQSGFPEPLHSRYIERYLKKLTIRLQCIYIGTAVRGGVEGIQAMPPVMSRKLLNRFRELGYDFAQHRKFNPDILKKLAPHEKLPFMRLQVFKLMQKTGFADFYWNKQLKAHHAFDKRFDQPFR